MLQVERLEGSSEAVEPLARRAATLRTEGLKERERVTSRRLMARMGAAALLVLAVAGILVTVAIDQLCCLMTESQRPLMVPG